MTAFPWYCSRHSDREIKSERSKSLECGAHSARLRKGHFRIVKLQLMMIAQLALAP